jgi:hypothetical protein
MAEATAPRLLPVRPQRAPRTTAVTGGSSANAITTRSPHHLIVSSPRTKNPIQIASAPERGITTRPATPTGRTAPVSSRPRAASAQVVSQGSPSSDSPQPPWTVTISLLRS